MKTFRKVIIAAVCLHFSFQILSQNMLNINNSTLMNTYIIVGTGQTNSYNNSGIITLPEPGHSFYGQNSNHPGITPSYTNNGNGTITDNVTGLMWEKTTDKNGDGTINYYDKKTYAEALSGASSCKTGGYNDWRLPTIKEIYSLVMSNGAEPNPTATSQGSSVPYINTNFFAFGYGDLNSASHGALSDERLIDAQYASTTLYVSTTMNGQSTMFGYNFADGRIKGYPSNNQKKYYVMYVRGNSAYGINNFANNGDGTITDNATGLMWMQNDNGTPVTWENALTYAENMTFAGYSDWRLPDIKELQSIVDYTRSPSTTNSAAIHSFFNCTQITNEAGMVDDPYYMSSTTFSSQTPTDGTHACYVSFGRAMGYMSVFGGWIDVHGAGAQRADPKTGNIANYPTGFGPQGDAVRINNFVRLVRNTSTTNTVSDIKIRASIYPNPTRDLLTVKMIEHVTQNAKISINSLAGELVLSENFNSVDQISIDTSSLLKGFYLMKIETDNGVSATRIVKN